MAANVGEPSDCEEGVDRIDPLLSSKLENGDVGEAGGWVFIGEVISVSLVIAALAIGDMITCSVCLAVSGVSGGTVTVVAWDAPPSWIPRDDLSRVEEIVESILQPYNTVHL
jgi:hypothetical protein